MATTAEAYGFGARAPYAEPRASDYDMTERVRLSGLFPRVRNEPMSKQLQVLLKEFEQNAALTGILERRRRLDERTQYELKGREALAALNTNLAPQFRTGAASFATSAAVASAVAGVPVQQPNAQLVPPAADAADVLTGGGPGVSGTGGSSGSGGAPSGGAPSGGAPSGGARGGGARSTSMPAQRKRSRTPGNKNRRTPPS